MMMDVEAKFDEDVWDDALFNIDDEPDSPASFGALMKLRRRVSPHAALTD